MNAEMATRIKMRHLSIAAVAVFAISITWAIYSDGRLVWRSPEGNLTVEVVNEERNFGRVFSRLIVSAHGGQSSRTLDDDVSPGQVRLVRFGSWILVVSETDVIGGYDCESGALVGEGEWEHLPITRWAGEGEVLAVRKLGEYSGPPLGFPR